MVDFDLTVCVGDLPYPMHAKALRKPSELPASKQ